MLQIDMTAQVRKSVGKGAARRSRRDREHPCRDLRPQGWRCFPGVQYQGSHQGIALHS